MWDIYTGCDIRIGTRGIGGRNRGTRVRNHETGIRNLGIDSKFLNLITRSKLAQNRQTGVRNYRIGARSRRTGVFNHRIRARNHWIGKFWWIGIEIRLEFELSKHRTVLTTRQLFTLHCNLKKKNAEKSNNAEIVCRTSSYRTALNHTPLIYLIKLNKLIIK